MKSKWASLLVFRLVLISLFLTGCGGASSITPTANSSAQLPVPSSSPIPTFALSDIITPTLGTSTPDTLTALSTLFPTATPLAPLEAEHIIDLTYLQMIDEKNGWAIEYSGHILHTEDSGYTWRDVTPPVEARQFFAALGFFALDDKTAWATAEEIATCYIYPCNETPITTALIWRTRDGGKSWQAGGPIPTNVDREGKVLSVQHYYPVMMQFIDQRIGWLLIDGGNIREDGTGSTVGGTLFHTKDGGETWAIINDYYHDLRSLEAQRENVIATTGLAFTDAQTGWLGKNKYLAEPVPVKDIISAGGWKIQKTTDGGRSFFDTPITTPGDFFHPDFEGEAVSCGFGEVLYIAAKTITVEWGCTHKIYPYYFFSITTDNGQTWITWRTVGNEFFLNAKEGWRQPCAYVGTLCPIEYTSDSGTTWTAIKEVNWGVWQLDFVNTQNGWALVLSNDSSGTKALVHTINGGNTWTEIRPKITN